MVSDTMVDEYSMFVAQPIEWTDRGVVMLDQRRQLFFCHSERSNPGFSRALQFGAPGRAVEESWQDRYLAKNRRNQGNF